MAEELKWSPAKESCVTKDRNFVASRAHTRYISEMGEGTMTELPQRREDPRYFLPSALGAEMEFDGPDGTRHRFPLLDISIRGASFTLPLRFEWIDAGAMLGNAVIRIDDLEIQGNLTVLHATARFRDFSADAEGASS